ncbi:MAG: class I SAM-dependent methyltransferase [Bacteroidetes bacterium]|nr:class I SAM-dependent methyltransferase [Bacteroidota bacterium]
MLERVKNYIKKQSFKPDILSIAINPFYFVRKNLFLSIKKYSPLLKGRLIDFGCGRKPYEQLFKVDQYLGVDVEQSGHDHKNSKVDVFFDGKHLPFDDNSFDSAFCSEVLEHVFEADQTLRELRRVLKPGATVLITVPFCWNEHEVPYDFARYSSFGIKYLLEKNGYLVIESEKSGSFGQVIFQLMALYFFEVFKRFGIVGYAISLIFAFPINLIGFILTRLMPSNKSLYFNNIILAKKD